MFLFTDFGGIFRGNFEGFLQFIAKNSPNFLARAFGARVSICTLNGEAREKYSFASASFWRLFRIA